MASPSARSRAMLLQTFATLAVLVCGGVSMSLRETIREITVPSSARPGHILLVLPYNRGCTYNLRADTDGIAELFSVGKYGELVTTRSLSTLTGKSVPLTIFSNTSEINWREVILMNIPVNPPEVNFAQDEYVGYCENGGPVGTEVEGLEEFALTVGSENALCEIVAGDSPNFYIVKTRNRAIGVFTKTTLDKKKKEEYVIIIKASHSSTESYAKVHIILKDVINRPPKFEYDRYGIDITMDTVSKDLLQVNAKDEDLDDLTYYMQGHPTFGINSESGEVFIKDKTSLQPKSYELTVIASDGHHGNGDSTLVRIGVSSNRYHGQHLRFRRSIRPVRIFLQTEQASGDLFTVATDPYTYFPSESYRLKDGSPSNLAISDSRTGVVTLMSPPLFPDGSEVVDFVVVITKPDDSSYQDELPVQIRKKITTNEIIFTNEPYPLEAAIPILARPGLPLVKLQSKDALEGATVVYKIESLLAQLQTKQADGSYLVKKVEPSPIEGQFQVDPDGTVRTTSRSPYLAGHDYILALSAQDKGSLLPNELTPAQVFQVTVGEKDPQFYKTKYIVSMNEKTPTAAEVVRVEARSFQNLPLQYSLVTELGGESAEFTIDSSSGSIQPRKELTLLSAPYESQFRLRVTVREQGGSGRSSTVEVVINLVDVNDNAPYYPLTDYILWDVMEGTTSGNIIDEITFIDRDEGENSQLTYSVDTQDFTVESRDNKTAVIRNNVVLDHDFQPYYRYQFTLTAVDHGTPALTGSLRVTFNIKNTNDKKPRFQPPSQKVQLHNQATAGTSVCIVQAWDPDMDWVNRDGVTFSFSNGGVTDQIFRIDSRTGEITLTGSPDKTKKDYTLTVRARDDGLCCPGWNGPYNTEEAQVTVELIGINRAPYFDNCQGYKPTLYELEPPGTSIIDVVAKDDDPTQTITYSMEWRDPVGTPKRADVHRENGTVYSLLMLYREGRDAVRELYRPQFAVTVQATDDGTPPLTAFCHFFITVGDRNNNAPQFDEGTNTVVVPTDGYTSQDQARLIRVFAVDVDEGENAMVDYSILSSDCDGCFRINPNLGWISRSIQTLTKKKHNVVVRATDRGTSDPLGAKHTDTTVTIEATSETNILPPKWSENYDDKVPAKFTEISPLNTIVATTSAKPTSGQEFKITYSIRPGPTEDTNGGDPISFREDVNINSTAEMYVRINKNLVYERNSKFTLRMRASNRQADTNHMDARLLLELIDANNQVPRFYGVDSNGQYQAAIVEDTPMGNPVIYVKAVDADATSPNNQVKYKIGSYDGTDFNAFTIDQTSGLIRTNQLFNRDQKNFYTITVIAEDGAEGVGTGGFPNSASVNVNIQITGIWTSGPQFEAVDYTLTLPETEEWNATVTTIVAKTQDKDEDKVLQYSITEGNELKNFGVDVKEGRIFVMGKLDYDYGPKAYNLTYRVFDGLYDNTTKLRIVLQDENDKEPIFTQSSYNGGEVTEKTEPGAGQEKFLAKVNATDPDLSRNWRGVRYSLVGPDNGYFRVDANTGQVYLTRPLNRDPPDGNPEWMCTVRAEDEPGSSGSQSGFSAVTVIPKDINDNAPQYDPCCIVGRVPEHSDANTVVMNLVASDRDEDENSRVSYKLLNTPVDDQGQPLFWLSQNVVRLVTTDKLDREIKDRYEILVMAEDNGTPSKMSNNRTIEIIVEDINDWPPKFNQSEFRVDFPEEQPVGAVVTTVYAHDLDLDENAQLTYSLQAQSNVFYIDSIKKSRTGSFKIKDRLDFDTMTENVFTMAIRVSDSKPSHTDMATVIVTITDINDNAPVFAPDVINVTLAESSSIGTSVAKFSASDIDSGDNKIFEYSIDYRNSDQGLNFNIDSNGLVTTRTDLNFAEIEVHNVVILAIDKGTPAQTGSAMLNVEIDPDWSKYPPVFSENYRPFIYEDTPIGQTIATIVAKDQDPRKNGAPFIFSTPPCSDNPTCEDFDIANVQGKGAVTTKRMFEREKQKEFHMPIIIKDSHPTGAASSTNTLTILVADRNDNKHSPGHKDVVVYNYKGLLGDAAIGSAYAEDKDDWDWADKSYALHGDTNKQYFTVLEDGTIIMKQGTPPGKYDLQVRVTDRKWNHEVISSVTVNSVYIHDDAVYSSGSVRIAGLTAEDFVYRKKKGSGLKDYDLSLYEKFQNKLAGELNTAPANVHLFTVMNTPGMNKHVDIRIAAHGSPWYRASKLDGLILQNLDKFKTPDLNLDIVMVPIDECRLESCWDGGCSNDFVTSSDPLLVNTNATSLVGVTSFVQKSCTCAARNFTNNTLSCGPNSCLNGGMCSNIEGATGFRCSCPAGFDGPRCQQLRVSFTGDGYGWYHPLEQCDNSGTSFEFLTQQSSSLLLYNGPMTDTQDGDVRDYIAVELMNGYPKVTLDQGGGAVTVFVDGKDSNGQERLSALSDGRWHRIDIFREEKVLRLVVDYCKSAQVTEDPQNSAADRRPCEAKADIPGYPYHRDLNVYTPLELGGRSKPSVNYPRGLSNVGFDGCIKNVRHNSILYDLHVGNTTAMHKNAKDQCPREDAVCGVGDASGPKCGHGGNGTCIGSMLPNIYTCVCKPGYRGDDCNTETLAKDFESSSFIEWDFKNDFHSRLNPGQSEVQLMFRTRQNNGMLWTAKGDDGTKHLSLEVEECRLVLHYDLGTWAVKFITLSHLSVCDGVWHTANVHRVNTDFILTMDGGEGPYYNRTFGIITDHRLIRLRQNQVFGGAEVILPDKTIEKDYKDSCLQDVRYNNGWFPMDVSENSESVTADLRDIRGTQDGCSSSDCIGVTCPPPLICYDFWRKTECKCPYGQRETSPPEVCTNITDCSIAQCVHGTCVSSPSAGFLCVCETGWDGERCDRKVAVFAERNVALSNVALGVILASILLLLLLILIFAMFCQRKRVEYLLDDPMYDDGVRENVVAYDEEGAGEEDMHAYDITRLQLPDYERDSMRKPQLPPSQPSTQPPTQEHTLERATPLMIGPDAKYPNVSVFVLNRLADADNDPDAPPYDSVREYVYEGQGSSAGSLSSLPSSGSGSEDFNYLNNWGPQFARLADMYGDDEDEEVI